MYPTPALLAALGTFGGVPSLLGYGAYRGARSLMKPRARTMRRRARIPKTIALKGVHTFKRTVAISAVPWTPSTGVTQGATTSPNASFSFSLQNVVFTVGATATTYSVPNYTQFTSLFDDWRIKGVAVRMFFAHTSESSTSNTQGAPMIHYVWDPTDNTVVDETAILQYEGLKQYQFANGASTRGFTTFGRPQALLGTGLELTDGTTTGGRPIPRSGWIETVSPTAEYNGLKMVFPAVGTAAAVGGRFNIFVDLIYELKGVI